MMRPRKNRRLRFSPDVFYFKPRGIPLQSLEEVALKPDEWEAIRLKYKERLNQTESAQKMRISQSTFQRILSSANQKIAEALVSGKAIRIEEG
ncbi:DUF134 domain-containing protein [Candidatus Peregrinibacteria bacterium]|nr:DUF134 domain-containing protein [Candidatus Peregrinibacteria bacterium]